MPERVTVRLTAGQAALLDKAAGENGLDRTGMIRALIDGLSQPIGRPARKRPEPPAPSIKDCVHPMSARSKGFCYECGSTVSK